MEKPVLRTPATSSATGAPSSRDASANRSHFTTRSRTAIRAVGKLVSLALVFGICVALLVELAALSDLWGFEVRYILLMLGGRGIVLVLFLNTGLVLLLWNFFQRASLLSCGSSLSRLLLSLWFA